MHNSPTGSLSIDIPDTHHHEETFDSFSPFLDPVGGMQYFASTPDPSVDPNDITIPRSIPTHAPRDTHTQDQSDSMMDAEGEIESGDTELSSHGRLNHSHFILGTGYGYSTSYPYAATEAAAHHYHPYRTCQLFTLVERDIADQTDSSGARSPQYSHRALEPLSPTSISPPSSRFTHAQLTNSPPDGISPEMISPASALGSPGSDMSPPGVGWHQPLPPGHYESTPHDSVINLPHVSPSVGHGLSMVHGYPYATPPPISRSTRAARPRATRARMSAVQVKQEADDDEDSDDLLDKTSGLGFSPEANETRITVGGRREDVRKARIESEQRRRDELRKGFQKLKEALPPTSLRPSKASLLDRSVAHIQSLHSENHALIEELQESRKQLSQLRTTHEQLIQAMSQVSTINHPAQQPASGGHKRK